MHKKTKIDVVSRTKHAMEQNDNNELEKICDELRAYKCKAGDFLTYYNNRGEMLIFRPDCFSPPPHTEGNEADYVLLEIDDGANKKYKRRKKCDDKKLKNQKKSEALA